MVKICAVSDLHGTLPKLDPCDLILICGDSVALNRQSYHKSCYKWYCKEFKPWADSLPCDKVLFIAGNHELGMVGYEEEYYDLFPTNDKVTFLFDDEYVYEKNGEAYRIYGTPWCKQFGHWAYMANNEQLKDIYSQIPSDLDILITHDQPYNYGDILLDPCPWADGSHIGNIPLLEVIKEKKPRWQFNGHLHSCQKGLIEIESTKHYNVSVKDENYSFSYHPLYLDITLKE